tara:strand:+ start:580 stop:684 length:105 start_codon:yes stop_codon:yes gene_type:complete
MDSLDFRKKEECLNTFYVGNDLEENHVRAPGPAI